MLELSAVTVDPLDGGKDVVLAWLALVSVTVDPGVVVAALAVVPDVDEMEDTDSKK